MSIQELIQASLSAVPDADIRKELTSNIILTGASSLYGNMEQRLSLELSALLPNVFKTKVIASRDSVERRFAPWIGASILSSLGSFQQLWLGQREYDEYGALLSLQRFP
jgi:actin-related protein